MIPITIKLAIIPLTPRMPSAKPNILPCSSSFPRERTVFTNADQYVRIVVTPISPNMTLIMPKDGMVEHHSDSRPLPIKDMVRSFLYDTLSARIPPGR